MLTETHTQLIDDYLLNKMSAQDKILFEKELVSNAILKEQFELSKEIFLSLRIHKKNQLKQKLQIWEDENKSSPFISFSLKKIAFAASFIGVIIFIYLFNFKTKNSNKVFVRVENNTKTPKPILAEKTKLENEPQDVVKEKNIDFDKFIIKKTINTELVENAMGFNASENQKFTFEIIDLSLKIKKIEELISNEINGKKVGYGNNIKTIETELLSTKKLINTYKKNKQQIILYLNEPVKELKFYRVNFQYYIYYNNRFFRLDNSKIIEINDSELIDEINNLSL